MKNDTLNSTAAAAGILGIAALFGAAPIGIATGCGYLAWKLLESKDDPNTIGYKHYPAPHRKDSK